MITFKQISKDEWQRGDYRAFAMIHCTTEELFKKRHIIFEEYEEEGLGRAKAAFFLTSNGRQFLVIEYLQASIPITNIFILNKPETLSNDLKEVLESLELDYSDLDWIDKSIDH